MLGLLRVDGADPRMDEQPKARAPIGLFVFHELVIVGAPPNWEGKTSSSTLTRSVSRKLIPPAVSFSKLRIPWRWVRQPTSPSRQPHGRLREDGLVPQRDIEHREGGGWPKCRATKRGRADRTFTGRGLDQRQQVVEDVDVVRRARGEASGGDRPDLHTGVAGRDLDARPPNGGAAARRDGFPGAQDVSACADTGLDGGPARTAELTYMMRKERPPPERFGQPSDDGARILEWHVLRSRHRHASEAAAPPQERAAPPVTGMEIRGGRVDRGEPARQWHAGPRMKAEDSGHGLAAWNGPPGDGPGTRAARRELETGVDRPVADGAQVDGDRCARTPAARGQRGHVTGGRDSGGTPGRPGRSSSRGRLAGAP